MASKCSQNSNLTQHEREAVNITACENSKKIMNYTRLDNLSFAVDL